MLFLIILSETQILSLTIVYSSLSFFIVLTTTQTYIVSQFPFLLATGQEFWMIFNSSHNI